MTRFWEERKAFHAALLARNVLRIDENGVPSNADKGQTKSVRIAAGIAEQLTADVHGERIAGQSSGHLFESICADFVRNTFGRLDHLRPGLWRVEHVRGRSGIPISDYEQYAHLIALDRAAKNDPDLAAALGSDYTISPDIVVFREREPDERINRLETLVDQRVTTLSSLRQSAGTAPILHASISCKWTIRSDRAQNARSEGLNLVKNRKGKLPHIAVVTAEPTPSRLASIALGTGEIDCVYHFALYELQAALEAIQDESAADMLRVMVEGNRLRDISDLPLDLAV